MKNIFGLLMVVLAIAACNSGGNKSNTTADKSTMLGAGSTFVYPLFSKLFSVYHDATGLKVNYQSIGSGGGILQLTNKTVDFGATDAALNDEQTHKINADVLHIPMCSGSVVLSYNLPSVKDTLKFTPDIVAALFLGKIKKWNDPMIQKQNEGVQLPDMPVIITHRSDGSGTTNIFTNYLSIVNAEWNEKVGKGSAVNWPTGLGGKGNEGVAGLVKQTPGAIGYIELAYVKQNNMAFGKLQNKSGNFITPDIASTSAAGNIQMPADAKVSLTNTEAADGYPISGFTWVIIYKEQNYNNRSLDKATNLLKLLWWNIHEGQKYCEELSYAPLSPSALAVAENILKSATYNGKPIL